jgi:hypothetical protein
MEDYKPFWRLEAIPQTAAIRFVVAEADDQIDNVVHARAAAAALKGPHDVVSIPGALHELTGPQAAEAARHAAAWLKDKL